jgi:hypothetical protein
MLWGDETKDDVRRFANKKEEEKRKSGMPRACWGSRREKARKEKKGREKKK